MQNHISVPFAILLVLLTASAAEGQQLFSDFPVNGQISAFQVSGGYSVSESFTLGATATIGQVVFGAWVNTGDSVTGVTWSIGTTPFGASSGTGVAAATSSYDFSNADGYDVRTVTFAVPGVTLPAGTYYLTLSTATSAASGPVYWDINDAASVDAWSSSSGHVSVSNTCFETIGISGTCASSFQILSANTTVTASPSSYVFPNQTANTTSTAEGITFTNNGPGVATIASIGISGTNPGDFAQTNNCPLSPATLAASSFCTINVTFTPKAANLRSAAITITGSNPVSVGLSGMGVPPSAPVWPNGYAYEATFTVAAGKVPSAQTNFPALISGTFGDFATTASGGRISNTCTQTVGNNLTAVPCDLIFTSDAAGTSLLSWEFETWTPATGAVNIWVNAPNLSNGTVIYAWYGQPSVTTLQTTPSATWSNNFMAVYHLKENPAGTAPQMNDSTANANHATMNGPVLASQQQPGEIDGSVNFEGNTWASLANPANFSFERTDSFSLSGWFKIASNSAGALISKFPAVPNAGWALEQYSGASSPVFALGLFGSGASTSALAETPAVTTGVWHYVVATYSGTGTVAGMNIYVDGVNQRLTTIGNNLATSIVNSVTPAINSRATAFQISTDSMDEIRISTKGAVFSAAFVTASFNNQSGPGTFFTVVTGLTNP